MIKLISVTDKFGNKGYVGEVNRPGLKSTFKPVPASGGIGVKAGALLIVYLGFHESNLSVRFT